VDEVEVNTTKAQRSGVHAQRGAIDVSALLEEQRHSTRQVKRQRAEGASGDNLHANARQDRVRACGQ